MVSSLRSFLACLMVTPCFAVSAEGMLESDVKFAFYSASWGGNTSDSLRLLVHNQSLNPMRLDSIEFLQDEMPADAINIELGLEIPAGGYAESILAYVDLLQGDECVERTLEENWKLTEISNYTLNPSVRNLIIENTDSFRIYQCIETVRTTLTDLSTDTQEQREEWVLFHFESRNN